MSQPDFPQALHVSGSNITHSRESDEALFDDPRGVVWMWEPPISGAKYIMGCDPTVGITGWQRHLRTEADYKTDNGAIEIFRPDAIRMEVLDERGNPKIDPYNKLPEYVYRDLQVAEFAAPVDAVEIARICNILGRIYAGCEDDQCELIYEAYPGPGILTTQELLRLGYGNLWMWEYIDSAAEQTDRFGWRSTRESQKMLWTRSRRHLMQKRAKIRSKWLLAEYSDAVIDVEKQRAKAAYGSHDDRMQAANMCLWAGHKWTYDVERTTELVTTQPVLDYQRQAPGLGEHQSYRDAWSEVMDGW